MNTRSVVTVVIHSFRTAKLKSSNTIITIQHTVSSTTLLDYAHCNSIFLSMNCESYRSFIQQRLCGELQLKSVPSVISLLNICLHTHTKAKGIHSKTGHALKVESVCVDVASLYNPASQGFQKAMNDSELVHLSKQNTLQKLQRRSWRSVRNSVQGMVASGRMDATRTSSAVQIPSTSCSLLLSFKGREALEANVPSSSVPMTRSSEASQHQVMSSAVPQVLP